MINKTLNNIIIKIRSLSNRKKLIVSILILLLLVILTKIFDNISSNVEIDYEELSNINTIYSLTTSIDDLDIYIQLKSIADDFIVNCSENNDDILKDIYNSCIYNEYRSYISKTEFINKSHSFYNKLVEANGYSNMYIPDNIVNYKDNFYILRYVYSFDNNENKSEEIECYLGIALDTTKSKYYIWYIE